MDKIIVRPLKFEDVKYIHLIETKCFTQPWPFEAFLMELDNKLAVNLVAEFNGEVVSYINARCVIDDVAITNVATNEEYRNKGIATTLMKEFLIYCEQKGGTNFSLEVRASNYTAITFYHKFGFLEKGVRKNFYQYPTEDAIIMVRF